jgi:hypothetical protein
LKSSFGGTGTLAIGRVTGIELLEELLVTIENLGILGKETVLARPRYVKFEVFSLGKLELSLTNDSPSFGHNCQEFFAFSSFTIYHKMTCEMLT